MTKLLSVRLVAILVGLGFAVIALYSFVIGAYAAATEEPPPEPRAALQLESAPPPPMLVGTDARCSAIASVVGCSKTIVAEIVRCANRLPLKMLAGALASFGGMMESRERVSTVAFACAASRNQTGL